MDIVSGSKKGKFMKRIQSSFSKIAIFKVALPLCFNFDVAVSHDLAVEGGLVPDGSLIARGQSIFQLVVQHMA